MFGSLVYVYFQHDSVFYCWFFYRIYGGSYLSKNAIRRLKDKNGYIKYRNKKNMNWFLQTSLLQTSVSGSTSISLSTSTVSGSRSTSISLSTSTGEFYPSWLKRWDKKHKYKKDRLKQLKVGGKYTDR